MRMRVRAAEVAGRRMVEATRQADWPARKWSTKAEHARRGPPSRILRGPPLGGGRGRQRGLRSPDWGCE
jgi:hypothetical protein